MKAFFLLQVSLLFLCVLSQSELIYIDQSTQIPLEEQYGSIDNPYSSLQTAFRTITQTTAILVFLGQSYTVDETITYESQEWAPTYITLRAPEGFTFNFASEGQIVCNNYPQDLLTPAIKNVNITFSGLTIGTQSTLPLFVGTCYFTFEDIFIEELTSTLMVLGTEGSALLRNFTINNIILEDDQNLIDQDSRERIEADYLILDSVYMKNTAVKSNGQVSAIIRSFLQYKQIEVTNSVLEGIGFNIKGEQIGGNNKTDILIKNVTMRNAENFFLIESYGNLTLEGSAFLNASNRAIYVLLADENLSPDQATFNNCLFQDNAAKSAGGALTFQSSSETNYQLYMTTVISGCQFINNQASFSGGALAFLFFKNANITILDSEFSSNYAAEAGGAIYVDKGESTMTMTVTNNIFDSNSAFTGGVFNFEFLNGAQIILENNVYTNNHVKLEGGIGFVTESVVTLSDINSIATGNRAGFQAGSWSLESGSNITFENITFQNSAAFLRGGCIVNTGAALTLNQVSFEGSTLSAISSTGGSLYVGENAVVKASNCQFSNSIAEFGAAIAIQSHQQESQSFEDITIECNRARLNSHASMIKSQIALGSGNLVLRDVTASNLQTPFFSQESGTANIQNIRLRNINCASPDDSLSFCIFGVEKNADSDEQNTLTFGNVRVDSVNSTVPLITADGSTATLDTMRVDEMDLPNNVPVWDIEDSILKVRNMELGDLDNNFVRSVNSEMEVVDSNFDYQPKTEGYDTNEYDLIPRS